jgi:hypothetical protein
MAPKELLLGCRPLKEPVTGPDGGEMGVAGEEGSLGKAEMLKTETLKGRMLRRTRELAETGDFTAISIRRKRSSPGRFSKILFGGCFFSWFSQNKRTLVIEENGHHNGWVRFALDGSLSGVYEDGFQGHTPSLAADGTQHF